MKNYRTLFCCLLLFQSVFLYAIHPDFWNTGPWNSCDNTNNQWLLNISGVVGNNTACTSSNGSIDITINPPGAYTYSWSNGATSEDLTDLPAGTYTVTVTDINGATQTAQFTVTNHPLPPSLSVIISQPYCDLFNGLIDVTVTNGVPPYTFLWSTGSTSSQISGINAGIYTVTVTGANGCTKAYMDNLPQNFLTPAPNNFTISPDACPAPGSIDLDYSQTTFPPDLLMFHWSNGATTEDIGGLDAGLYTVTVTLGSCTYTSSYTVPNLHNPPGVTATITGTTCNLNNGMINANASGGVPPYTYEWSNGDTNKKAVDLLPGIYTLTVTGANECTVTAEYTVPNSDPPIAVAGAVTPNTECVGGNGAISLQVAPPGNFYTYEWSDGETTQDIGGLPAGDYLVTVTGNGACSQTASFTVTDHSSFIMVSLSSTAPTCGISNGSIHLTAFGGGGTYTYLWSNGANTQHLSNIPGGSYSVTVSDGTSCSAIGNILVPNKNLPVAQAVITAPGNCQTADGVIDLSISGALPPYVYLWSNGATTEDLHNIPAGQYSVTINSANGCSTDTSFQVLGAGASFSLATSVTPLTNCLSANGAIDLTVTPAGTYTYLWSNGAITEDLTHAPAGTYTVAVSDNQCTLSTTVIIQDQRQIPLPYQVVTPEVCGLSNGSIELTVNGGLAPYSFSWSSGQSSGNIYGLGTGNYVATVSDANGCSAIAVAYVPADTLFFSLSTSTGANNACLPPNGSIDLLVEPAGNYVFSWSNGVQTEDLIGVVGGNYAVTVSAGGYCTATMVGTVTDSISYPFLSSDITADTCGKNLGAIALATGGGTPPFAFVWSGGAITADLQGLAAGIYTVTVTDAKGCTDEAEMTVPDLPVAISVPGVVTAYSSCLSPDGSVTIQPTPLLNYTYQWSNGAVTPNLNNLLAGLYTVIVTNGTTCAATAEFNVPDQVESPVATGVASAATCADADGGIDLTVSGGGAPYEFLWSNGSITEDLSGVAAGIYDVIVTAMNGCTAGASIQVPEQVVLPAISAVSTPNTFCQPNNGALDLTVSTGAIGHFSWSNGASTEDISGLAPGLYTVTVNVGGNCVSVASFPVVDQTAALSIAGQTADVLCAGGSSGSIDLLVQGGLGPFSYDWNPVQTGDPQHLNHLSAGDYSVTVTDQAMCGATAQFSIHQPASGVQASCIPGAYVSAPGMANGSASVDFSGGTPPYTVVWTPGSVANNLPAGSFTASNLGVGSYQVLVLDANDCSAQCQISVDLLPCHTAVGSMSAALLTGCGAACFQAAYDPSGQSLEPGDVLQFILHEGSGNQIMQEIARNIEPVFCFDPMKMQYGVTYYISAVAGNDDGSGNVDLTHFCTVVSQGTPVEFQEKPVAAIAPAPPISCAQPTVPLQGSSSVPGSVFQWTTANGMISGPAQQPVVTATKAGTYNLIAVSGNCRDTVSVQVQDITNHPVAHISASPGDLLDCAIDEIILSGSAEGAQDANTVWEVNGMVLSAGAILKIEQPGLYQFIIIDTTTFCRDTARIQIGQNHAYPPLFIVPPQELNCRNQSVTLSGSSPFPGINFQWAFSTGTDTVLIGNGPVVSITQPGAYLLTGIDPVNTCSNVLAVVVQEDRLAPLAKAGVPFSIHCYGDTVSLDGSASSGASDLLFGWTTANGLIVGGADSPAPRIARPGVYELLVTNPRNGCQDTDQVLIGSLEPTAAVEVVQPLCAGDNGQLLIDSVSGATPPIRYSLDNGQTFTSQPVFKPLAPGIYNLIVEDATGCSTTVQAQILPGADLLITLDPEVTLTLGESYQVQVQLNIPVVDLQTAVWTPATGLSCDSCLEPLAMPLTSTQYHVSATSKNGCQASAPLRLIVDREIDLYVPNVFTPNADGKNDVFTVFANPLGVRKIKSLQVYSRWGELVWETRDFMPNDPGAGWDGTFRGKKMDPAVFIWQVALETIDGEVIRRQGDVTLER